MDIQKIDLSKFNGRNLLEVSMNLALNSGKTIPAEKAELEAEKKSKLIPEEIKKEFISRLRAGDLSVWQDERVMSYM